MVSVKIQESSAPAPPVDDARRLDDFAVESVVTEGATHTPTVPVVSDPHVVVIGCGFAGLYTAQALDEQPVRITVIDRRNHHLFQPLLYQVATAQLEPADIAEPIRSLFRRQKNAKVILGEVTDISPHTREIGLANGNRLAYDYLVLASGSSHNYFGNEHWAALAPGMKSVEDALDIRRRILSAFERAELATDPAERAALLTFIIVGAGPTGVELAGSIAEIAHDTLAKELTRIDPRQVKVILVEGLDRVLPPFPAKLSRSAHDALEDRGVIIKLKGFVTAIDEGGVTIGRDPGELIPARTVIWSAGVKGSPLAQTLGVELDRAGRVLVNDDLRVPGHPEVFVIGDLAAAKNTDGQPVPGVAPAAMQSGTHTAANIMRLVQGDTSKRFRYNDKGNLAIIARNAAVADVKGFKFSGFLAWFVWSAVHLFYLNGIRNRISVLIQWIGSYLGASRGARVITDLD